MTETEFQVVKAVAVVAAFAFALLIQRLYPYRGAGGGRGASAGWPVNLSLAALNVVLVNAVCGGCVCLVARWASEQSLGLFAWLETPHLARVLAAVAVLDLVAYGWHRANHRVPLLWRFHAVHHSDRGFDASTAVRFHPGEILVSLGLRSVVVLALGIPVAGILAFEIVYAAFNFFEHGDIGLGPRADAALAALFVTPALHRKHHSTAHPDVNFGTVFSLWDRLFGSFAASSSKEPIVVGLPGEVDGVDRRLAELLAMPLKAGSVSRA